MKAVVVDSKIIDLFKSFDPKARIFAEAGIDFVVGNAWNDKESTFAILRAVKCGKKAFFDALCRIR